MESSGGNLKTDHSRGRDVRSSLNRSHCCTIVLNPAPISHCILRPRPRPRAATGLPRRPTMKRILWTIAASLLIPTPAWATWSIIAIDINTGRMVISSATCAATGPNQLRFLQAIVVPGVAIAAAQARLDRTQANHRLIFEELRKQTHPEQIIKLLEADPDVESRQFAIVDRMGRTAGRTGADNGRAALHVLGESADGIVFSVQGNIIASNEAILEAARIMEEDRSPIIDRVMLALERTDELGGDVRCTCETEPLPAGAICTGKTAHAAYILAADPHDPMADFSINHPADLRAPYNAGNYLLDIGVWPANTLPSEDANPVRTLRTRYDTWKSLLEASSP